MKKITILKLLFAGLLVIMTVFLYVDHESKKYDTKIIKPLTQTADQTYEKYLTTQINTFDSEPHWYPAKEQNNVYPLEINATAGIIVDINSNKVLFDKNSDKVMPIASLTKIMTAIVALEHANSNDKFTVSEKCQNIGENSMTVYAGEIYTLEDLLYGLILNSGNDAACVIAQGTAGDVDTFVHWMNFKAKDLGMSNTIFYDPSGLDDRTHSTPLDLVKLTRYALKFAEFRTIAKTAEHEIPQSATNNYHYLYNQTNLLSTYPGVEGVKTGYTEKAGLCLVTYANNNGKELIGVVLNSGDRKGDMILMLDFAYNKLGINIEHSLL